MKQHVIQVTVSEEEKELLKEQANKQGLSSSKLGRAFITKGLTAQKDQIKAADMVQSGQCPNLDEALKLIKAMRGEW